MKKQDLLKYIVIVCAICVLGVNSLRVSAQGKQRTERSVGRGWGETKVNCVATR